MSRTLGIWITVLFAGVFLSCGGCRKSADSSVKATSTSPKTKAFIVRLAPNDVSEAVNELGLQRTVFEVGIPKNTWCTIWVETYVEGKLYKDLTFGESFVSGRDETKRFCFSRFDPNAISEGLNSKQTKWACHFASSQYGHWAEDPFKKLNASPTWIYTEEERWEAEVGHEYIVYHIIGRPDDQKSISIDGDRMDDWPSEHPLVVFVKVRFEPKDGDPMWENAVEAKTWNDIPRFGENK